MASGEEKPLMADVLPVDNTEIPANPHAKPVTWARVEEDWQARDAERAREIAENNRKRRAAVEAVVGKATAVPKWIDRVCEHGADGRCDDCEAQERLQEELDP